MGIRAPWVGQLSNIETACWLSFFPFIGYWIYIIFLIFFVEYGVISSPDRHTEQQKQKNGATHTPQEGLVFD